MQNPISTTAPATDPTNFIRGDAHGQQRRKPQAAPKIAQHPLWIRVVATYTNDSQPSPQYIGKTIASSISTSAGKTHKS
jgi:hypothetical protein